MKFLIPLVGLICLLPPENIFCDEPSAVSKHLATDRSLLSVGRKESNPNNQYMVKFGKFPLEGATVWLRVVATQDAFHS